MADQGSNQGRTVARALDLLETLERASGPLRLSDIAHEASLHVATAQRTLNLLVDRGYVQRTRHGYALGAVTLSLAHGFAVHDRLSQVSTDVLSQLSASTGLTSSVFVRSGHGRIVIARVDGAAPLRYQFPLGQRLPLELGGGKVLLAGMPSDELEELLTATGTVRFASGRLQTPEDLRADVDAIRERGYHLASSERSYGVLSLTCLLRHQDESAPGAAINLVATSDDAAEESLLALRPELERAGQAIVARL